MDTCKDATSATTPTKLIVPAPFCVYDLITAHHNEYHGATCEAWKSDLNMLVKNFAAINPITTADLPTIDLTRPECAQLRKHLLKWGFVKESPNLKIGDTVYVHDWSRSLTLRDGWLHRTHRYATSRTLPHTVIFIHKGLPADESDSIGLNDAIITDGINLWFTNTKYLSTVPR